MTYHLEKRIWTEADFDEMGWHDSLICKMCLQNDLELDIDYILKWNQPEIEGMSFTFWIAPSTLVFKNVKNITFDLDIGYFTELEISDIERSKDAVWTIVTQQGDIQFESNAFEQFIRQDPSYQFGQNIPYNERNGFSLERTINHNNPNLLRNDIIEKRKADFEHYEIAKGRQLKNSEMVALNQLKEEGKIELKDYLLHKRGINAVIDYYTSRLKGTLFEG